MPGEAVQAVRIVSNRGLASIVHFSSTVLPEKLNLRATGQLCRPSLIPYGPVSLQSPGSALINATHAPTRCGKGN